ncbi:MULTISPECIES: hypothetical protein [unclassified Lysinibacillus]|uniref:hypothetical protein n=1 Tax=unclassified Lysinibacillus TaxID=2636778 RepID=UPI002552AB15|nr:MULTISPECIES: hypothetical protein [unclassified Lysinibacillus]MDM5248166.1 hypothetical protein [Lysinibacillus sp. G4S2]
MKKPIKKTWMIASALTIGMAVLTPLQAGAASVETSESSSITVQLEQKITGTIKKVYSESDGMILKGIDGKNYFISLIKFSDEQLEKMNLVEGQEISVEGSLAEDYSDFYTFDVYKKGLPKEVTQEDLTKLEKMFNEIKKLRKEVSAEIEKEATEEEIEKKYEEIEKIYKEMDKIRKPYIIANWQPQSFEEYMKDFGFNEANIVIKENDNTQLKAIYEEWIKLEKSDEEEKANDKYKEFYKILGPYLDELNTPETFEEFMDSYREFTELIDIPAETLAKLKTLHGDLQKALKDENNELYDKLHEEFYGLLNQFEKPQTFEEYMADFEFEVSEADSKQLKQLYEEILALDEKEEQEKSKEKWEALYNILNPYFIANKEILISASKVTINGQDYLPQH